MARCLIWRIIILTVRAKNFRIEVLTAALKKMSPPSEKFGGAHFFLIDLDHDCCCQQMKETTLVYSSCPCLTECG